MGKNRFRNQNQPQRSNGQVITLTTDEMTGIRNLEQALVNAKCQVSDLYLQLQQAAGVAADVERRFLGAVRQVATDHGIAVDDPLAPKWHLNTRTGTFEKVKSDG